MGGCGICDYNYVFDPNVYLKRFFGEGTSGGYIFLIDEAHNLVDRGREMYSAFVDRADVLEAKKLAADYSKGLVRALGKVTVSCWRWRKTVEIMRFYRIPDRFL